MSSRGQFSIPADHACLPGHFPGSPVIPGVVLLDETFAVILADRPDQRIASMDAAKFLAPVLPEQSVTVEWVETAPDRIAFSCVVREQTVLRGQVRLCKA